MEMAAGSVEVAAACWERGGGGGILLIGVQRQTVSSF